MASQSQTEALGETLIPAINKLQDIFSQVDSLVAWGVTVAAALFTSLSIVTAGSIGLE